MSFRRGAIGICHGYSVTDDLGNVNALPHVVRGKAWPFGDSGPRWDGRGL